MFRGVCSLSFYALLLVLVGSPARLRAAAEDEAPPPLLPVPEGAVVRPVGGVEKDPVKLKAIYDRYTGSKFAEIAHELAREMVENPYLTFRIIPEGKDHPPPWSYTLSYTLRKAWDFHTEMSGDKPSDRANFDVLMSVLEDATMGPGRSLAVHEIRSRFYRLGYHPAEAEGTMPPVEETMRRLRAIASNGEEKDIGLRRELVQVIYQYGDPNEVLDLAIELTSRESDPQRMVETFQATTPVEGTKRLTKANRAKYLRHGFLLLGRINDGKSGKGANLAANLGRVIGIEPLREGLSPFSPDPQLPEYGGGNGRPEAFFQKAVNEAMAWWEKHRGEYE